VILAYGTVDDLPEIEGLEERWGTTAFHCPYCHGYEVFGGRSPCWVAPWTKPRNRR
jgi:Thioredoxin reductase